MKKTTKARLDWALEKLNDVSIAGYALGAARHWADLFNGTISVMGGVQLAGWTLILLALWGAIGELKASLEED